MPALLEALRQEAARYEALTPDERDQIARDRERLEKLASAYPMEAPLLTRVASHLGRVR